MEILDNNIYDYLIFNGDPDINSGLGYFIKDGTPASKIEEIREYHKKKMKHGKPYFILDFLAEDLKNGVEIERGDFGFYPKRR